MGLRYDSIEFLVEQAEREGRRLSELCLEEQAKQLECSAKQAFERMAHSYEVMKEAAKQGGQRDVRSASGLTGGDAFRMMEYGKRGKTLTGRVLPFAMGTALAVSEWNAAMGRIVAAPTAGSCGILPAALLTAEQEHGCTVEQCVMALFTASAFGMVIANRACIAGAQGGCQAECGSASAMAAAALVELGGGSPAQSAHAAAIALKCVLGLVCDPVAGLVEIPCIKRNAAGVTTALMAAEMALAGIESAIPADEVILAMKRVGDSMSPAFKETAEGGLADTMTGRRLCRQVFGGGADN